MPVLTLRAGLGSAALAAVLVLAPVVPAGADSPSPAIGSAGVIENSPTAIDFHNREATGEIVTYAVAMQPRHGTAVVIGPTASTVLYTPDRDYVGDDSFTVTATGGVTTPASGIMQLSVVAGASTGPRLSTPRSTSIPPGGIDGDASSRLTISGQDFIDSQPDGHTHVLPAGADVIEAYQLGGGRWVFEEISRNAYEPVQLHAEFAGAVDAGGGLALGAHPLVPSSTWSAGAFSLNLSAFHAGCSRQPGSEEVQRFDVGADGLPVAVDLTFAVTCDADTAHVMTGSLHWRAANRAPVSVSPPAASVPSPSTGAAAPTPTTSTGTTTPVAAPVSPSPSASSPDPAPSGVPVAAPNPVPAAPSHAATKQRSRTSLSRVARASGRVRLTVTTERIAAVSSTWVRWGGAIVRIEERTPHGWRVIATVSSSTRGSAAFSVHASRHSWRAVTTGTASVSGSTSSTRTR